MSGGEIEPTLIGHHRPYNLVLKLPNLFPQLRVAAVIFEREEMIIECQVIPKPFLQSLDINRSHSFEVFLYVGHCWCADMLSSVPKHARFDLQVVENRVSISSEVCKVPNVVITHCARLTQLHHRLVMLVHEGRVRVIQEVKKLRKSWVHFVWVLPFDYLVVELYSVRV